MACVTRTRDFALVIPHTGPLMPGDVLRVYADGVCVGETTVDTAPVALAVWFSDEFTPAATDGRLLRYTVIRRGVETTLAPRITGYVIGEPGAPLTSDDAWHVSLTSPIDVPTVPLAMRGLAVRVHANPSPAPVVVLSEPARMEVYDVLGRRVYAADAPAGPFVWPPMAPGRYLWRAGHTAGSVTVVR